MQGIDSDEYRLSPEDESRLLSPALIIDLDRVRENVERITAMAGGDVGRWRPHVKTTKIPEIWQILVDHGIRHFKCATTKEARVLASTLDAAGVDGDILIAYPHVGPALHLLDRIATHAERQTFSILVESAEAVAEIPESLDIFVDVNPDMDRTGIPRADVESLLHVTAAAGHRLRGLHYYDGHLHDGDPDSRRERAFEGYGHAMQLIRSVQDAGGPVRELITSGTPSFPHALAFEPFRAMENVEHRVSPGTVVYHDTRSAELDEIDLVFAAHVLTRVVSHPRAGRVTCDAGSKSIAAEAGDPCAVVSGHPHLVARTPSEEHLPLDVMEGDVPARGDVLMLVPHHVCPTVNLAEEAALVEGGRLKQVVSVGARAHDLLLDGVGGE